ncbi:MAG: fatty acid desaturase [Planctomycetes bacterium]|nr:fatty acid desaturase [Planctomycetota bacterium]
MLTKVNFLDRLFRKIGVLDPSGPLRANPRIITGIVGFHLLALLACIPWLFSWTGVVLAVAGIYVFGTLGVNIGFHRLMTHRGFACPRWLEHSLSVLGSCCWQGTPMNWVAIHRMHHQHSDDPEDPHSPNTSFFWSHMGWFLIFDPNIWSINTYDRYARDLLRDRFYKKLERPRFWRLVHLIQWAVYLVAGAIVGAIATETLEGTAQMAMSFLVWGVFVRTVLVWHITWSVNSVTHIWGYRNFKTKDNSRNNLLVGLISNGEGWHNNHHAQPRSAAHGMRWWELDVSYTTIRIWEKLGLVWDVVKPRRDLAKNLTEEEGNIGGVEEPKPASLKLPASFASSADVSSGGEPKNIVPDAVESSVPVPR